jgi:regulator of sigma E protease
MGPVGIVTLSYRIVAREPFVYYAYFLGLISACIAVFNCLPLLPFDGGQIVFLLVEKVKGSAVSAKFQEKVSYAGLALIGALFIYVTFNDIVRSFFS